MDDGSRSTGTSRSQGGGTDRGVPNGVDPVVHRFVWDAIRAREDTRGVRHLCAQIHLTPGNPFWYQLAEPPPAGYRAYRRDLSRDALRVQTDVLAGLSPATTEVADALAVRWEAPVSVLVDTARILVVECGLCPPDGSMLPGSRSQAPESSVPAQTWFGLPRGISVGQTCLREDRAVKNGRWCLVQHGEVLDTGYGDLSFGHLYAIAATLNCGAAFIVLRESSPRVGPYEPLSRVSVGQLAEEARFAIVDGRLHYADPSGGNRLGYTWIPRGHHWTRTGRVLQTGRERVMVIKPKDLAVRLRRLPQ